MIKYADKFIPTEKSDFNSRLLIHETIINTTIEVVVTNKHAAKLEFKFFISIWPSSFFFIAAILSPIINAKIKVYAANIRATIAGTIETPNPTRWSKC